MISIPVRGRDRQAHSQLGTRVHRPVRVPLFREDREVWVEVERGGLVDVAVRELGARLIEVGWVVSSRP